MSLARLSICPFVVDRSVPVVLDERSSSSQRKVLAPVSLLVFHHIIPELSYRGIFISFVFSHDLLSINRVSSPDPQLPSRRRRFQRLRFVRSFVSLCLVPPFLLLSALLAPFSY